MDTELEAFVQSLDEAEGDLDREALYSSSNLKAEDEQILARSRSRDCGAWLSTRLCISRPGASLPPVNEALGRLLRESEEAEPADAYAVLHGPELPPRFVLVTLQNSLIASLKQPGPWSSQVLIWFVRAVYAMGDGGQIWALLDALLEPRTIELDPLLRTLRAFHQDSSLNAHPAIVDWFRAFWPLTRPPACPRLPSPPNPTVEPDYAHAISALRRIGADDMADLLGYQAARRMTRKEREADPLIRSFREAAVAGQVLVTVSHDVPDWIEDWLRQEVHARHFKVAAIASRSLVSAGALAPGFITATMADFRAVDVALIRPIFEESGPDALELVSTIERIYSRLDGPAADAAAYLLWPGAQGRPGRFADALEHLDVVLAACHDAPLQRQIVERLRESEQMTPELAAALTRAEAWLSQVATGLGRLRDRDRLDEPTLRRLLADHPLPETDEPFLTALRLASHDHDETEVSLCGLFVVALESENDLQAECLMQVVRLIGRLGGGALMPLRYRLIRRLWQGPIGLDIDRLELKYLEGRTLWAVGQPENAAPLLQEVREEAKLLHNLNLEVEPDFDTFWAHGPEKRR